MATHSLVGSLKRMRGNVRACVYTEPLWGIPANLYMPYVSVYMLALGLTDRNIGLLASLGTLLQVFWTVMGGAITDKLGRKRATLIFDILSWSVPCLIWAVAQNFTYFVIAVIFNAMWRVPDNSWHCLLVEDAEPDVLVDVYSWVYISGRLAAFVTPLAGFFVGEFGLVPTMRVLYLLAFVMMTTKFLTLNALATETQTGRVRMEQTQHQSLFHVLSGFPAIFRKIVRSPVMITTGVLMALLNISMMIRGTFWSILVAEELHIPEAHLALFSFTHSIVMLIFFFVVMPRIRHLDVRGPMLVGFGMRVVSTLLLVLTPPGSYLLLMVVTVLEAASVPLTYTLMDKLKVTTIEAQERARINALLKVVVLVLSSPFGWIAGELSSANRRWPFVLSAVLFGVAGMLTYLVRRAAQDREAAEAATTAAEPALG